MRDLLRKRTQLVRQKVTQMLSLQSLITRTTGATLSANQIKRLNEADIEQQLAVAYKLSRACYYVMRDQVRFDVDKAFA